jgi:cysteine desulfurase
LKVEKFLRGGHQERNLRAGTINVAGAVGFGVAAQVAIRDSSINNARIKGLRDYMITQIELHIPDARLNGHRTQRLPNSVNFSFKGVEGEALLTLLDFAGIAASTGSACTSTVLAHSHVLSSMGVSNELINGSIRFSLGRSTTKQDIDYTVDELEKAVKKLRGISALNSGTARR